MKTIKQYQLNITTEREFSVVVPVGSQPIGAYPSPGGLLNFDFLVDVEEVRYCNRNFIVFGPGYTTKYNNLQDISFLILASGVFVYVFEILPEVC